MKKPWTHSPYRILDKSPSFRLLLTRNNVFVDPESKSTVFPIANEEALTGFNQLCWQSTVFTLRHDRYYYSLADDKLF